MQMTLPVRPSSGGEDQTGAPAPDLAGFLDAVRDSGVLGPGQLRELDYLGSHCREPRDLGRALLDRDWMTPFQVNQVHRGSGRELVLGPYVLLERLGGGGMGQVFKARHRRMDRLAALKVIHPDLLRKRSAAARFLREVQAAARLDHPNIIHAYDAGLEGSRHYLAMEFVDGTDLRRMLERRGPLKEARALEYVRQAALGLQHALERGVVHRDIKPSNLLVSRGGVVKLLDLGLARLHEPEEDAAADPLTRRGAVLGTADYVAPEQALDSRGADTRSDLYSLGCTLYHLLAGRPPFPKARGLSKLIAHATAEPEPLAVLRPGVSPRAEAVVRRLMAKRPRDRYQTPGELAAALAEPGA